mmetsp:Transcript_49149/g.110641  ORF Transcript_49149/g.110641 Transcript_49149/m.110641 type:complete len:246 (-) Transcript_49149:328-1065(-)
MADVCGGQDGGLVPEIVENVVVMGDADDQNGKRDARKVPLRLAHDAASRHAAALVHRENVRPVDQDPQDQTGPCLEEELQVQRIPQEVEYPRVSCTSHPIVVEEVRQLEDTPVLLKLRGADPSTPQKPEVHVEVERDAVGVDVCPGHEGSEVPVKHRGVEVARVDSATHDGPGCAPRPPAIELVRQPAAVFQRHSLVHLPRHELLEQELEEQPASEEVEALKRWAHSDTVRQPPDQLLPELQVRR